ncbi:hypothetical protein PRZ48_009913 [Zasmidium cellare]|uniref:Uncharacterized protein n=1 Tax=Zasmidium cellare TaxID=395010 RepID=A0ABR0ED18_ZASCE|nr:hypothetical protein PRZ48_009913 [Zasmidium cellare]
MAVPLEQLLAYRATLTDALDNVPINSRTQLYALHQPNLGTPDGRMLQNLTAEAYPSETVSLVKHNGEIFPPADMDQGWLLPKYRILATFNRLLTAPVLRIEVVFDDITSDAPDAPHSLKVIVDFHFNAIDDGTPGVTDLSAFRTIVHSRPRDEIRFTSYGATSEGFPNALKYRKLLGHHGNRLLRELQGSLRPQNEKRIRIAFHRPLTAVDSTFGSILPYITGPSPLPSLSVPEWSALLPLRVDRDMLDLMDTSYPFTAFECGDTYATVTDAAVELYESSRIAALEQEVALREWASVRHSGVLYEMGGALVFAVRFSPFRALGGIGGIVQFSLPDSLHTKMSWTDPMTGTQFIMQSASHCCVPVRLPAYDALFVLTEPSPELRNTAIKPSPVLDSKFVTQVEFAPKVPQFTLKSQLNTAVNLQHPDASRWHQVILNQSHQHPVIDLATKRAAEIPEPVEAAVQEAFHKMLTWRDWNEEQLAALHSVRSTLGGIMLITGPAGTGKTLILQAITAFLYAVGLHVLVLCPANSNANDFMRKLKEHFPQIPATRVYPSSKDFSAEKIMKEKRSEEQVECTMPDTENDTKAEAVVEDSNADVVDVLGLEMIRADLKSTADKYADEESSLPAQVLRAAREGKYSLKQGSGEVDIWYELRQCIEKSDSGEFNWLDKNSVKTYDKYYQACKAHYVSLQTLLCTTTGNVRTCDIIDNFARDRHDVKCAGLVLVIDESAKDREIDTLSALLIPDYRSKITGVVLLGDERQLEPTNTSAKGAVTFNPFKDRLSIPFLSRLKSQGFPCVELREQHRMSCHISAWPSRQFYPHGAMRDGPGTYKRLKSSQPGLFACLKGIMDSVSPTQSSGAEEDLDRRIRSHYFDVRGTRDNSKRSAFVREHPRFFFEHIYWPLRAYYGEKMQDNVMVICAYKGAKNCWLEAMGHIQQQYQIPTKQMAKILTIDSSQGAEAQLVIIDCSVQGYSHKTRLRDVGFVDDPRRMNVAFTRAREVRWVIGGDCGVKRRLHGLPDTPAYVRYREEVGRSSQATTTPSSPPITKFNEGSWLDEFKKKEVELEIRYADEVAE